MEEVAAAIKARDVPRLVAALEAPGILLLWTIILSKSYNKTKRTKKFTKGAAHAHTHTHKSSLCVKRIYDPLMPILWFSKGFCVLIAEWRLLCLGNRGCVGVKWTGGQVCQHIRIAFGGQ